ncbi:MAG: histidine phosphatase family protein, partial [Bacteroidia bacterium]|nr:histidine phosphatase family protein [Bacteroidia bacterium]
LISQWTSGNLDARVAGGESATELIERCRRFLQYLRSLHTKQILVCTHGRTLRCLICLIKEQEMAEMENYRHANTGLFQIQYHGSGFEVIRENDIAHLNGFQVK